MAVVLTAQQLDYLARSAAWKFDVSHKDARNAQDSVIHTGDGMDDLTRLIDFLESKTLPNGSTMYRIQCDTGGTFSNWITVTIDDVYALRQRFIEIWGSVAKPPYWDYSAIVGGPLTTP